MPMLIKTEQKSKRCRGVFFPLGLHRSGNELRNNANRKARTVPLAEADVEQRVRFPHSLHLSHQQGQGEHEATSIDLGEATERELEQSAYRLFSHATNQPEASPVIEK